MSLLLRLLRSARFRKALRVAALAVPVLVVLLFVNWQIQQRRQAQQRAELSRGALFFDDQGRRLRYSLLGADQPGPTIVLLSGFVAGLEQWDLAQHRLSSVAPVLTYDRGGSGLSDPGLGYDADAQADELARLSKLEQVKLPLVLVAYSSAAFTARAFARRHPELIGGMVLIDPTLPEDLLDLNWVGKYIRYREWERGPMWIGFKTAMGLRVARFEKPFSELTPAQQRATRIYGLTSHWWAGYQEGKLIARSAEESRLDWTKLHIPVALLSLAQVDGTRPSRKRYQAHLAMAKESGAEFVDLPGRRHDLVTESPEILTDLLRVVVSVVDRARVAGSAHPQ